MNKTENINLAGNAFIIDQDAFRALEKYINSISKVLKRNKVNHEVLEDIEFRIAELLNEELYSRSIVSLRDIEKVQKIMGEPKIFVSDREPEMSMGDMEETSRTKKRLYRNPEDKLLGGVASGLAAYFGIKESWFVRLLFIFTVWTMGLNVFLYILLWATIPAADSESDFAEMRGEGVDFSDIADSVKSEIEELRKTITS